MTLRINQFCCGCSLRTGAVVAAILTTLSAVVALINASLLIFAIDYANKHTDHKDKEHQETVEVLRIFAGSYFAEAAVELIVLVCLVIGLKQNKAQFIIPWLIAYCIMIILTIFATIYQMTVGFATMQLITLLLHCFMIYLWFAVYSYYQQLREGSSTATATKLENCYIA